jgi:hypothetical protein
MDFLIKILQILLLGILIFLWNKFIVTTIVKTIVRFHKKNNANNIDKQPVKFVVDNELNIIKYAQYFYWFGGLIIAIRILFN